MSQPVIEQQGAPQSPPEEPRGGWTAGRVALVALALAAIVFVVFYNWNSSDRAAKTTTVNANASAARPNAAANPNTAANPNSSADAARTAPGSPVPLPDNLKNKELKALDGTGFKLADYQGKVLVLNIWASWCNPCRAEIPQIAALYDDYKPRGVEVVGLTMEDDNNTPSDVERAAHDMGINYRVAWAEKEMYASFLAPGYQIPQTYIIDRQGRIRKKFVGGGANIGNWIRATLDGVLADKQG
ncbi:MAG: TlpA family protein disulfide reductase [Acidobacteriota bacterium]|nr:TlpA family protein disulfide reductase [Acidobacteriota bacterium]